MSTYGQVRLRLTKLLPGVDQELIDGWIQDRYQQILDALPWQRRDVQSIIQTAAPVTAGTITVASGTVMVTGSGTGWTSAITGSGLYVAGRNEFYELTYVSPTSATLDRAWEGDTVAGTSYRICQSVYTLPTDCRILKSVRSLQHGALRPWDSHQVVTPVFGAVQTWRPMMDTTTGQQQIEVWPIPDGVYGLAIEYTAEDTTYSASDTTVAALPWIREGAIVAGVQADGLDFQRNYDGADRQEARYASYLADMIRTECKARPNKVIKISSRFSSARWKTPFSTSRSRMTPGAWDDAA